MKFRFGKLAGLTALLAGGLTALAVACGSDAPQIVVHTVVVEKVVEKPVEKIVKETVVVKQTVAPVIVKETAAAVIVKETVVVQQTVVSQQTVVVVQTATATPIPVAKGIEQVALPAPKSPVGTAFYAFGGASPGDQNGLCRAQACEGTHYTGIGETLFFYDVPNIKESPWIGTSWVLQEDLNAKAKLAVIVKIRKGIPFHKVPAPNNPTGDWGTLSATDVAFSINDANFGAPKPGVDLYKYTADYTKDAADKYVLDSIHGQAGDFDIFYEVQVIDAETIKIPFISFTSIWLADLLGQPGQAISIASKKAHDYTDTTYKAPGDFLRAFIVETGPFQIESWARDDKIIQKSRYSGTEKHYIPEITPKTARIVRVFAPDPTSRVALLRAGDVDLADILAKDVPQFSKDGKSFLTTSTNNFTQGGLFFSGNLWEDVNAKDNSPINVYAAGGVYNVDWPWIGDRRKPEDLEEARQVRWALSEAINRDEINKAVVGCLGTPVHVMYVSVKNPRMLNDGKTQGYDSATCKTDVSKLKYGYNYDVKGAQARLTGTKVQGDYFKGTGTATGPLGNRSFEVSVYSQDPIFHETTDAIAGYWTDLGLKVFVLKYAYQTFRPTLVNRTSTIPIVTGCDKGFEANPWFFPKGLVQTTLSRGGFSCGFESPEILRLYTLAANEKDPVKGSEYVDEYIKYMYDQALMPGAIAYPTLTVMNSNKVKAWPMPVSMTSSTDAWWALELVPGK